MSEKIPRPRVTVKGIFLEAGKILTIKKSDKQGSWFVLPGGGQKGGESLTQALMRECREELGAEAMMVENLIFVRDYIGKNHEFRATSGDVHQIDHFFSCRLLASLGNPVKPDKDQVALVWVDIHQLQNLEFYPKGLVKPLQEWTAGEKGSPRYLGDIN